MSCRGMMGREESCLGKEIGYVVGNRGRGGLKEAFGIWFYMGLMNGWGILSDF